MMKKVYLTLGAVTRNQSHNIQEWLYFHHIQGFERFIIGLHQCTDDTKLKIEQLKSRYGLDIITHDISQSGKIQMGTYKKIIEQYSNTSRWLLVLDSDEFAFSATDSKISDILTGYEQYSSVSICQQLFASNGYIYQPEGLTIKAYTKKLPSHFMDCKMLKSFFNPEKFKNVISPHYQLVDGESVLIDKRQLELKQGWYDTKAPIYFPILYNHYYTGSMSDWVWRTKRGCCNDKREGIAYSISEFKRFFDNCTEEDTSILKYESQMLEFWYDNYAVRQGFVQ
jgi:hypothetical protein